MDSVIDALTSMHNINKSTKNSHVENNLIHTLHRMQTVEKLDLIKFKDFLMHEEYEHAKANKPRQRRGLGTTFPEVVSLTTFIV